MNTVTGCRSPPSPSFNRRTASPAAAIVANGPSVFAPARARLKLGGRVVVLRHVRLIPTFVPPVFIHTEAKADGEGPVILPGIGDDRQQRFLHRLVSGCESRRILVAVGELVSIHQPRP